MKYAAFLRGSFVHQAGNITHWRFREYSTILSRRWMPRILPVGLAPGHALHQEAVGLAGLAGLFGSVDDFAEARIGLLVLHPGDARRLPRLHLVAADHPALGFVVVPIYTISGAPFGLRNRTYRQETEVEVNADAEQTIGQRQPD